MGRRDILQQLRWVTAARGGMLNFEEVVTDLRISPCDPWGLQPVYAKTSRAFARLVVGGLAGAFAAGHVELSDQLNIEVTTEPEKKNPESGRLQLVMPRRI